MATSDHADRVDLWLGRVAKTLTNEERLRLFENALAALWRRAHVTLGEVTLGAVTERVLYFATEKHAFLSPLVVEHAGVKFDELRMTIAPGDDVTGAFRFVLIEFLTVLGNLTDDILTPALHSELATVSPGQEGTRS
jgi:hypothetical protein